MTNKLTIAAACVKYGFDKKRLIGFCARNDLNDPLVVEKNEAGEYLILDDWRLQKLAEYFAEFRTASKASGGLND